MTQFAAGRGRLLLAIVVGILAADRATKILADRWLTMGDPVPVIPGFFQLTLVYNTGWRSACWTGSGSPARHGS